MGEGGTSKGPGTEAQGGTWSPGMVVGKPALARTLMEKGRTGSARVKVTDWLFLRNWTGMAAEKELGENLKEIC